MSLQLQNASLAASGVPLLRQLDFELRPGRVQALLGPNGAGKSTLLKLLTGDLKPDTGKVLLDTRALQLWPPKDVARRRAALQQIDELRFPFSVREVIRLGRLPWDESARASAPIVEEALEQWQLTELVERSYTSLSGGERTRVNLARCWAQLAGTDQPAYLLLDEPLANQDLAHRTRCKRLLSSMAERGMGVLVVLHEPADALNWVDECCLIKRGEVLTQGIPSQVLNNQQLSKLYNLPIEVRSCVDNKTKYLVVSDS